MKNLEDFKEFYYRTLLEKLAPLEEERKRKLKIIIIIALVLFFLISSFFVDKIKICIINKSLQFIPSLLFYAAIPFMIILSLISFILLESYRNKFKSTIINEIIKFIDPTLEYFPHQYVPKEDFLLSKIFMNKPSPDRYKGEDLIKGKIQSTSLYFSEVYAYYKTTYRANGREKEKYIPIFRGLFFIADFNKNFKGKTFVFPDVLEKIFGSLSSSLQTLDKRYGELVKLENPAFEKEFVVYSNDQIEARYILSTSLMERMLNLKNKLNKKIYFSFVDTKIFIAISEYNKNFLEPTYLKTLFNYEIYQKYLFDLIQLINIVEELNLNTRIWTKI